jgi:hypothetical protein
VFMKRAPPESLYLARPSGWTEIASIQRSVSTELELDALCTEGWVSAGKYRTKFGVC